MSSATLALPFATFDTLAERALREGVTRIDELRVLTHLVSQTSEQAGWSVEACRDSIAQQLALSGNRVGRILVGLRDLGLLVRRQWRKARGEVAVTVLTRKAYEVVGLQGGVELDANIPDALRPVLAMQCAPLIEQVCASWRGEPGEVDWSLWAGSPTELHDLQEALAFERSLLTAEAEGPAPRVLDEVALGDGTLCLDQDALSQKLGSVVDTAWLAATLKEIHFRAPLTTDAAVQLIPELVWSRKVGFGSRLPWKDAVRAIASLVWKGRWGKPKGLPQWFPGAAVQAMQVANANRPLTALAL